MKKRGHRLTRNHRTSSVLIPTLNAAPRPRGWTTLPIPTLNRNSKAKTYNPLRYDPSRTLLMRNAFKARLHKQFSTLKVRLLKLVGGGQLLTDNIFNPDEARDEYSRWASDPVAVKTSSEMLYRTEFKVGEKLFGFEGRRVTLEPGVPDPSGEWNISFGDVSTQGSFKGELRSVMTHGPNVSAIRVLDKVHQSLDSFIKDRSPKVLTFSATMLEPSKVKVYNTLAQRLADKYGYTLKTHNKWDQFREYTLTKNAYKPSINRYYTADDIRLAAAKQPTKIGDRASVIDDDGHLWGTGTVTHVAERTEVIFDSGSGGMWPNRFIHPEVVDNQVYSADQIHLAAAEVNTEPTLAQIEAGSYAKGHITVQGLPITIETPAGVKRKPWHDKAIKHHYGYIKRAISAADGDHVDVFLGPDLDSDKVYVVDQVKIGVENVFNPEQLRDKIGRFAQDTTITEDTRQTLRATFKVGNDKYKFTADEIEPGEWSVDFLRWTPEGSTQRGGQGDVKQAVEVFSKASHLLLRVVDKRKPISFSFEGDEDEPGRIKLYDTFGKRIEKITGYQLKKSREEGYIKYTFTRPATTNAQQVFDEHKCLLGFHSTTEAKAAYLSNYSDDWQGFGGITEMTMAKFKEWLKEGDTGSPIANAAKFYRPENYDKIKDLADGKQLWAGANDWEVGWTWAWLQDKDASAPEKFLEVDHAKCPGCQGDPGREDMDHKAEKECQEFAKEQVYEWAKPATENQYCPTGPGGGQDNSCGKDTVQHLPNSLGIRRLDMPQIARDNQSSFVKWAKSRGVDIVKAQIEPDELHPTQHEYDQARVDKLTGAVWEHKKDKPVLVSLDNRVLDGTHHWLKHVQSGSRVMPVIRIGLPAKEALALLNRYPKTTHADVALVANAAGPDNDEDWEWATEDEEEQEKAKPSKVIDIPNIPAPDNFSCGAAQAMGIGKHLGVGPQTLGGWKTALGTTAKDGTPPPAIVKMLHRLGLHVIAKEGMSLDDLEDSIAQGMPILCPVQDYTSRLGGNSSGHYLTVIGLVDGHIIVQDSSADKVAGDSGRKLIAEEDFLKAWHDQDGEGNKYIRYGIAVDSWDYKNAITDNRMNRVVNGSPDQLRDEHGRWAKTLSDEQIGHELGRLAGKERQTKVEKSKVAALYEEGKRRVAPKIPDDDQVAKIAHEVGRTLPATVGGGKWDKDGADWQSHRVILSDVYDAAKSKLSGMTLSQFKDSLLRSHNAGKVELSRLDMIQSVPDSSAGKGHERVARSTISHVGGEKSQINVHSIQARKQLTGNYAPDQPREHGRFAAAVGMTYDKAKATLDKIPGGKWMREQTAKIGTKLEERYGRKQALAIIASGQAIGWGISIGGTALTGVPVYVPFSTVIGMVPGAALAELHHHFSHPQHVANRAFIVLDQEEVECQGHTLVEQLMELWRNRPTLNAAPRFTGVSDPAKVKAFGEWINKQSGLLLTSTNEQELWGKYIQAGYKKGALRSYEDVKGSKWGKGEGDFYEGSKAQFLADTFMQPVAVERVQMLAGQSFDLLKNVTTDMATKMTRVLVDGLIAGSNPRVVAKALSKALDMAQTRANVIAQTELIRAHASGQLQALKNMGVEQLGVEVEWSTSGLDGEDGPCEKCAAMQGVVLSIEDAQGLLPLHPDCKCCFTPANVGEDESDQIRGKAAVSAAMEQADLDPDEVFNTLLGNAFCPTGEGGGVDDSCGASRVITLERDGQKIEVGVNLPREKIANWLKNLHGKYDNFLKGMAIGPDIYVWDDDKLRHDQLSGLVGHEIGMQDRWADRFYIYPTKQGPEVRTHAGQSTVKDKEPANPKIFAWAKSNGLTANTFCATGEGGGVKPDCTSLDTLKGQRDAAKLGSPEWFKLNTQYQDKLREAKSGAVKAMTKTVVVTSQPPASGAAIGYGHTERLVSMVKALDKGNINLVHLADLRAAHPDWPKPYFDKVLEQARREGKLTLSPSEGRHGTSKSDHAAAVYEKSSVGPGMPDVPLVYASLRHPVHNDWNADLHPRDTKGRFGLGGPSITTGSGERLHLVRQGKDKVWRDSKGVAAPEHIQKLGIPPGWNSVHVNADPEGTMLARGVDSKGRHVYCYSDNYVAQQAANKFGRIRELMAKRTAIFKELEKDSRGPALKDKAECLRVIMQTGMRPGSDKDTKADYQSYGATTLEGRHVVTDKDGSVALRLVTGKNKGREVTFPIHDKQTAAMLKERAKAAGPKGRLFNTTSTDLRDYSKTKDGGGFRPKDIRTALGTEVAVREIKQLPAPSNSKEYKDNLRTVATAVSNALGNTPTIALKSYIDPIVFTPWRNKVGT